MNQLHKVSKHHIWTAIVLAALALLPFAISGYQTSLATQMLIFAALILIVLY